MSVDGKIHIKAKRRSPMQTGYPAVKLTMDAYNALAEIYNESEESMCQIASKMILDSVDRVVYDKED